MIDIVEVLVIILFEGEFQNWDPAYSIVNKAPSDHFLLTINAPVVYMARYVMVLRHATSLLGALEGVGPENRDLFGPKKIWDWYFRPSFVNCCPSPLLSGSTFPPAPFPVWISILYVQCTTYTVRKGGGGYGFPGLRQKNTCRKVSLQVNFFRWQKIFALPSMSLIFLCVLLTPLTVMMLHIFSVRWQWYSTMCNYMIMAVFNWPQFKWDGEVYWSGSNEPIVSLPSSNGWKIPLTCAVSSIVC